MESDHDYSGRNRTTIGHGSGNLGPGGRDGTTYELHKDAPKDLLKPNLQVRVKGQVREDVMTIAMIGPVLEVKSFELLEP
ncbi:hypothetical protein [Egbenema bharatensis]|uniref:hypothetical protein n=1 Tax=Egbenema bharatensis TaxID=3463334 RepID=UPI003A876446